MHGDLAAALDVQGWCSIDDALPDSLARALAEECADDALNFTPAYTGRRAVRLLDPAIRSDTICWLDASLSAPAAAYLAVMEQLRVALNERLFLGLLDYECHYARYAPGAFYARHRDAFAGGGNRVVSTVLYLNADWTADAGGELLLYDEADAGPLCAFLPQRNRLVLFLSERFPHEVKPATRMRHSVAGWFRVRA
jgi:SM-20-related protein